MWHPQNKNIMLGTFRKHKSYWQYDIAGIQSSRSGLEDKIEELSEKDEPKDKKIGQRKFLKK